MNTLSSLNTTPNFSGSKQFLLIKIPFYFQLITPQRSAANIGEFASNSQLFGAVKNRSLNILIFGSYRIIFQFFLGMTLLIGNISLPLQFILYVYFTAVITIGTIKNLPSFRLIPISNFFRKPD